MTFHVALSTPVGAMMVSDSQGSTSSSEIHGWQKQFVGEDFLVGFAGHGAVIGHLMAMLHHSNVNSTNVEEFLVDALNHDVRRQAAEQVEVLLVRAQENEYRLRSFHPAIFTRFNDVPGFYTAIGSGAEFSTRALQRDSKLGIVRTIRSIADVAAIAESLADSANESITVDDQLFMGMMIRGRSYMLGDQRIFPEYGPRSIVDRWLQVSRDFRAIQTLAVQIRSTMQSLQRHFSPIWDAELSSTAVQKIEVEAQSLQTLKNQLNQQIEEYCKWYDEQVGRPYLAAPS